jgi:hypothetical protein
MHRLLTLVIAALTALTWASEDLKRQASITNAAEFSSAASQLISLYLPSSVQSALALVASEAGSITTDISAAVESALTATSPPPWLNAVPAEYSSNIASLESAVSALYSYASEGSIPNAPYVVTTTSGGSVVVSTSMPASTTMAVGTSSTKASVSTLLRVKRAAQIPGAEIDGLPQGSTARSTTSVTTASPFSTNTATHLSGTSSSALAVATQAPVVAGIGILGLLGVIAAL